MSAPPAVVGFDLETHLIRAGRVIPEPVCLTLDDGNGKHIFRVNTPDFDAAVELILKGGADPIVWVAHNLAFDLPVLMKIRPDLAGDAWQRLEGGAYRCTLLRQQLIDLGTTGELDKVTLPDGSTNRRLYNLAALGELYLGKDRSAQKKGDGGGAWRTNFAELEDVPLAEWPQEAIDYAIEDATDAREIFYHQQALNAPAGATPANADEDLLVSDIEILQAAASVAFSFMAARGFRVSKEKTEEVALAVEGEMHPTNFPELIDAGILVPESRRLAKRQPKEGPPKYNKTIPEKISKIDLQEYVWGYCKERGISPVWTDKGVEAKEAGEPLTPKFVSVGSEFLAEHGDDEDEPILFQYKRRQNFAKLLSTYVKSARQACDYLPPTIYTSFNTIVRTGRSSSRGSKLDTLAATNLQNQDPRIRPCFVARPGTLLISVDYSALELVTTAQTCFDLFGYSHLKDLINAGVDVHAYLGSRIAQQYDPPFAKLCDAAGARNALDVYNLFCSEADPKTYKHYRKMAKPLNLGFPGGIGPDTMSELAWAQYGVRMTVPEAKILRELWRNTYPEVVEYLKWIGTQDDERNKDRLFYRSPLGLVRRGCLYCAAANGRAMQSPAADGTKLAVIRTVRESYFDPSSPLAGHYWPLCFVHDELLGEALIDEAAAMAVEVGKVMREAMSAVCPDVKVGVESVLMRHWDKYAEPSFDASGIQISSN